MVKIRSTNRDPMKRVPQFLPSAAVTSRRRRQPLRTIKMGLPVDILSEKRETQV